MTTAETVTNLLLAGILAVLVGCWIRYAQVDQHIRKLPERLYHLVRDPALRVSRMHRSLQDNRAIRKRRKSRELRRIDG